MIKATEIYLMTNFQKNTKSYMGRLEESKEPIVLTVNGKAKLIVQDAEAYQLLLDQLERVKFIDAVRVGLGEAEQGKGRPVEEAFQAMKLKYGL